MLRFRFPRCPPFRICFRELAPSELKHAFADAGSAPGNLESSQCQSFFFFVPSCAVYVSCMVHGRRIHLLPCALLTFRYPVRIADNKSIILQTSAPRNQSCFRAGRQIPHPAHRTLSQTGRSDRFLLLRTPTSAAPVLLPK